mmetsp:Transcript_65207/g.164346  ORF Transcript_65207/g.164346 Transcript_65207/m.164346 type:complete len:286 (+) Transcript_65207:1-858(+)
MHVGHDEHRCGGALFVTHLLKDGLGVGCLALGGLEVLLLGVRHARGPERARLPGPVSDIREHSPGLICRRQGITCGLLEQVGEDLRIDRDRLAFAVLQLLEQLSGLLRCCSALVWLPDLSLQSREQQGGRGLRSLVSEVLQQPNLPLGRLDSSVEIVLVVVRVRKSPLRHRLPAGMVGGLEGLKTLLRELLGTAGLTLLQQGNDSRLQGTSLAPPVLDLASQRKCLLGDRQRFPGHLLEQLHICQHLQRRHLRFFVPGISGQRDSCIGRLQGLVRRPNLDICDSD